jgi:LPXTG-motif cell wall-anchored protein
MAVMAQRPREIVIDNDPVDWSDRASQVVLIGIPLVLLIFGIFYFRKRQQRKSQT